jgi:hypothetical protein
MYVFDTNVFRALEILTPKTFPTIWKRVDDLVLQDKLWSVKEVRRELNNNSPSEHIADWVRNNSHIFKKPNDKELYVVSEIFKLPQYLGLVKRANLLKGLPVADPFIVASAKVKGAFVVTQENHVKNGARIPNVCEDFKVGCIKLEEFFEREKLKY